MGIIFIFLLHASAQNYHPSIHAEQQEFYNQYGAREAGFYDSLSGFSGIMPNRKNTDCQLNRIVFGFHPYWAGSDYLNYQWNLLSDLCYFSYEVDPSTGEPVTYHDWLGDPAIDSAQAHGVKVHLCATIFSGHAAFFTNLAARQNLISNLIALVQQRNADGVNMDIEVLPSSMRDSVTVFMQDLSNQLKTAIPGAILSIDLPAVDWSNNFQINSLTNYLDYFFIMGYDYYWNGSAQAGPVSPLYSLTSGYDYSLARSVSTYEYDGVKKEKLILGVPYYGRQWKTQSNSIPSNTMAYGTALTYSNVRNNSGTYNPSNYHWENSSFSSCYIFFQNDNWNQCFIGLDRDARKWYNVVNYRNLAGIGIWALGYDDGYLEMWQAISDKFSDCYLPLTYDSIYDSGGPSWNYYTNEEYIMTLDHGFNDTRWLSFTGFGLEQDFDSLWLYAGPDTTFALLGKFSGHTLPGSLSSPNGVFTLRFKSDGLHNALGWMAIFHDGSIGMDERSVALEKPLQVYPNPAKQSAFIVMPAGGYEKLFVYDIFGRNIYKEDISRLEPVGEDIHLNLTAWSGGVYTIVITHNSGHIQTSRLIKLK